MNVMRFFVIVLLIGLAGFQAIAARPAFVIRPATSLEKVFRDTAREEWLTKEVGASIHASACRNEREAVQAVVLPLQALTNLRWKVTSPIGAEAISVAPVAYVDILKNSPRYPANYPMEECFPGWWPDPIQYGEDRIASLAARQCQPLWILIDVPINAPAGWHTIRVDISADGVATAAFTVNLRVYDFTLPDRTTLKTSFWTDQAYLRTYYPEIKNLEPIERGFLKMALDNRITPINIAWLSSHVETRVTEKGDYVFDYRPLEKWLEFVLETNPRKGNLAALGQHSIQAYKGSPASWSITGNDGKTKLRKLDATEFEKLLDGYFRDLRTVITQRGWDRYAYLTICDEPTGNQEQGIRWAREICKRHFPDCPTVSAGNFMPAQKQLDSYVDIWAPGFFSGAFGKADWPYWQQHQKDGREVWAYVCYKTSCIDYQPIDMRINPWLCWKFDLKGFLYWGIVNWSSGGGPQKQPGMFVKEPELRWPNRAKWQPTDIDRSVPGDGYLMYPGPEGQAWSSIRLENFRDGVEDYEYLAILKRLVAKLEKTAGAPSELIDKARELLVVGEDLVPDHISYSRDSALLTARRDHIGEMIETLIRQDTGGRGTLP